MQQARQQMEERMQQARQKFGEMQERIEKLEAEVKRLQGGRHDGKDQHAKPELKPNRKQKADAGSSQPPVAGSDPASTAGPESSPAVLPADAETQADGGNSQPVEQA